MKERAKVAFQLFKGIGLPILLVWVGFFVVMSFIAWVLSFVVGILPAWISLMTFGLLIVVHYIKRWRKYKASEELIYRENH